MSQSNCKCHSKCLLLRTLFSLLLLRSLLDSVRFSLIAVCVFLRSHTLLVALILAGCLTHWLVGWLAQTWLCLLDRQSEIVSIHKFVRVMQIVHTRTSFVRCQLLCNLLLCWFSRLFLRLTLSTFLKLGAINGVFVHKMRIPHGIILSESKVKLQIHPGSKWSWPFSKRLHISVFFFFSLSLSRLIRF